MPYLMNPCLCWNSPIQDQSWCYSILIDLVFFSLLHCHKTHMVEWNNKHCFFYKVLHLSSFKTSSMSLHNCFCTWSFLCLLSNWLFLYPLSGLVASQYFCILYHIYWLLAGLCVHIRAWRLKQCLVRRCAYGWQLKESMIVAWFMLIVAAEKDMHIVGKCKSPRLLHDLS